MGKSEKNINAITPPVYVLLPICTEWKTDVFLNILKNVVARSKLDDNFLENALKLGMTGDTFSIDFDDISINWSELKSKTQQIRQSKLLGFWAIRNFPSLGKKLLGETWEPSKRKSFFIGNSKVMEEDDIDAMVFQKMKLRIIQLSVSHSTVAKLKHFVKVPFSIGKHNELQISRKIKSFDIESEYLENCWKALKFDIFPINAKFEQQVDSSATLMVNQPETLSEMSPCMHREIEEHQINSGNGSQLVPTAKRARLDVNTDNAITEDINSDSTIDSFRMVVLEMRKDIGNLTKWLDPNVAGHEEANGPERLHIMIIKQKDEEIAQVKASVHELLKVNETLKNDQSNLRGQIETKTSLINALEKVVEANCKLLKKSESDLAVNLKLIDDYKGTTSRYENTIRNHESVVGLPKESETELHNQIQNLDKLLVEAEKIKLEFVDKNEKLLEELNNWKKYADSKDEELHRHIQNFDDSLVDAEKMKLELSDKNREIQEELNQWKSYADIKYEELVNANKAFSAEKMNFQKLQEELNVLKDYVTNMVPELQNQTHDSNKNLAEAETETEKMNFEMAEENREIRDELNHWKNYAASKDKELKDANKTLTEKYLELKESQITLALSEKAFGEISAQKSVLSSEVEHLKARLEILENRNKLDNEIKEESAETSNKGQQSLLAYSVSNVQSGNVLNTHTMSILPETEETSQMNQKVTERNNKGQQSLQLLSTNFAKDKQSGGMPSDNSNNSDQESHSEPIFETDDPIVKQWRDNLRRCQEILSRLRPLTPSRWNL